MFPVLIQAQVRIKMTKENGVYTMPCTVNELRLRFIFDTGASNVCISLSEAIFMLKNGYMSESDLKGASYSQIASGEIIENTSVILREVIVGGIKLHDVEATIIHELSAPLLLGQSAIQRLGKLQIEGEELVITQGQSAQTNNGCTEALFLLLGAKKHYLNGLYALASANYQKAWDLCPNQFICIDFDYMGASYYYSQNYQLAIEFLTKAENCEKIEYKFSLYFNLSASFKEINNYNSAMIYAQKALSVALGYNDISHGYASIASIYHAKKMFYEAEINYGKSIEYWLKKLEKLNSDVMQGTVKDLYLGELYYNMASVSYKLNQSDRGDGYLIKSALCGDEESKEFCKKYGLKYELFKE